jgi:DNA polymerase-3 subunit alpha
MFTNLHVHTEYSILDGVGKAKDYVKRAKAIGQTFLGITNHANIDGFLNFQSAAKKEGIKPIFGCELYVAPDASVKNDTRFHLTALIKNETGFQNLCKMLTYSNLYGFYRKPRVDFKLVLDNCEGLVFLSGCSASAFGDESGTDFLMKLSHQIPGDFYLEVMPHLLPSQSRINKICVEISYNLDLPLVATNDCHYINKGDDVLHEVLLAIQTQAKWTDPDRFRFKADSFWLRSEQEMKDAFIEQGVLSKPQYLMAIRNTAEVAGKCSNFEIKKKEVWLPVVKGIAEEDEGEFLTKLCMDGYLRIFGKVLKNGQYLERFLEEFELIKKKKFIRYFLVVEELISWCHDNGILTGPGRGSVGGSLIAFLLGITTVDPIKYGLLFSRFIDENRGDLPDVDIDFEDIKRYRIREHLEELYGKRNIASVSTFMKMKGRAVIRDVSRVFDVPIKDVGEFAKSIVEEENDEDVVERSAHETPEGQRFLHMYPDVVKYASQLEGQIRGTSQHAAAIIVSAEDLTQGTRGNLAVRSEQEVVNWAKDDAEYMGLMKLDILALNTLSVLNETKRLIKKNHGKEIVFESISLDNEKVFESLSKGETVGVFQFDTWSMTKLVKRLGVDSFGLMSDAIALVRPGPADSGMTDDFILRKHGARWKKKNRIYEKITKDTFGIVVYQEQVMQVIHQVAGLPYSTADKIRKVIGKKRDAKEFKPYEDAFVNGCLEQNTFNELEAREFWEALQSHARYSFNKSHSTEYAMISYWCSWLKLQFPAEFICAHLTYGSNGKKEDLVKEAQNIGLNVILPKPGISDPLKWVVKDGNIYIPFMEIKGVGPKTAGDFVKCKPKKQDGFFDLGELKPTGKIAEILKRIESIKSGTTGDLFKDFSFNVSPVKTTQKECFFIQKHWRNTDLVYCELCGLRREAKRPVMPSFGIYNVMIIGEAPGSNENEEGKGFIGKSGDLLWKELARYSFTRRQFHISNTCKCYPGNIKTPSGEHIKVCSRWLDEEIKMTNTRLCLALGNVALKYFKGEDGGIMKLCGTTEYVESKGVWVSWGLHPSSVLHNPTNKPLFEDGIRNFVNKINSSGGFK